MKKKMASITPNRNQRVILECNIIYVCGTKIKKKFGEVYNEGTVKFYNYENKKYRVLYNNGEEEDLSQSEIRNNLKSKRRRRNRTRNITSLLGQRNLHGEVSSSKDSDTFGDEYPKSPEENCSIITYQNIGQQTPTKI